jgi:hypothetical protein
MSEIKRRRREPSYRNLQIYHEVAYLRRTQTAVAPEIGVSQRRISEICRQVRRWVDRIVPPEDFFTEEGQRLHLAIAHERIRLRQALVPLAGMFTTEDGEPRYLRRYIALVDGEPLHTIEVSEQPDFHLLDQAARASVRLAELEAIAHRGPFADLPDGVQQTIVHRYRRREDRSNADQNSSNASEDGSSIRNHGSNTAKSCSNTAQSTGQTVLRASGPSLSSGNITPCDTGV